MVSFSNYTVTSHGSTEIHSADVRTNDGDIGKVFMELDAELELPVRWETTFDSDIVKDVKRAFASYICRARPDTSN